MEKEGENNKIDLLQMQKRETALRLMCKLCAVQINLNVVALSAVTFSCCSELKKEGGRGGERERGTGALSLFLSPRDQWPGLTTSTASTSPISITTR